LQFDFSINLKLSQIHLNLYAITFDKTNKKQNRTQEMTANLSLVASDTHILSQEDVIAAACMGDKEAFRTLYELHHKRVYALCLKLCADKSQAEDACQEVFIQLWDKLANYKGDSKFSTWLHSVTSNVTISYIRKQRGWWQKMFSFEETEAANLSTEMNTDNTNIEHYIAKLPERARWVFVLHSVEGYRHEEISEMLGMAVGSSKAQLHRAKKLLQEWMINE
jgi:RNA polymerase sigma-70 factor (ECF subfamily)